MIKLLFLLATIFILILTIQKFLINLKFLQLKNKIKNNPSLGVKQEDNNFYYKEEGYTISYKIEESGGTRRVEWLSLKRQLTPFEENISNIKRSLNKIFLYQRWFAFLRPSILIILILSLTIFYFGIKEHMLKRIEHLKWVVVQMTGIKPERIEFAEGEFRISGERKSSERKIEPVTINFNPLRWLFSNMANVSIWSEKLKKYVNYPVSISDKGDVWLGQKNSQVHGKAIGDKIIWDEPQRIGISQEVSGHRVTVENGNLRIIDE